jgi:hypothetical protein
MVFLIEYDRDIGRIVTIKSFVDCDRERADKARLELELELNAKGIENEVVLLEAANEEAVRRTHRRYFEDLHELASPSPSL